MGTEENLKVIDEELHALNAYDFDRALESHAESVLTFGPGNNEPTKGRTALRNSLQDYLTAFPDFRVKMERAFGQGDWVCGQYVFEGTHKGPLLGPGGQMIPATNRSLRLKYVVLFKFQGGLITERHEFFDNYGLMTQLGQSPATK